MHRLASAIFGTVILTNVSPGACFGDDLVFDGRPVYNQDYGYLVRDAAWRFQPGEQAAIFVCWENPSDNNQEVRLWVSDQIDRTWAKHTKLAFRGWQKCSKENAGIRILLSDEGPHVKAFGRKIDGLKNGMVLNDKFYNWSPECQVKKEYCIRSIAAHEFGHALGFAHEQNRPDTPGECAIKHGQDQNEEIMLTPYDPQSVMNYCNSRYNNDGTLSEKDIMAAQMLYQRP